jgi:hypothetical protein
MTRVILMKTVGSKRKNTGKRRTKCHGKKEWTKRKREQRRMSQFHGPLSPTNQPILSSFYLRQLRKKKKRRKKTDNSAQ